MAKSRRRRNFPGRRRKIDAPRKPSGKIRDALPAGPTPELLAMRAELVGAGDALHQDAAWWIGRLHLTGKLHDGGPAEAAAELSAARRDAAERFRRLCEEYGRLLLAPREPGAIDPNRQHGRSLRDTERYELRLHAEYDASFAALHDAGRAVLVAVGRACRDEEAPLLLVKRGLDALAAAHQAIKRAGREAARAWDERRGSVAA